MVHNGIEYGLMAAYAEGLNILSHANVGKKLTPRMRRRLRCVIPNTINMISIWRTWPKSGAAAAS